MDTDEANKLIASTTPQQRELLTAAHSRYMHFTGVWSGSEFSDAQIKADRAAHSDLLAFGESGVPVLSDKRCGEFMHRVCGLPVELCMAYDEIDFLNEHGSYEELEALTEKQRKLEQSATLEAQHEG